MYPGLKSMSFYCQFGGVSKNLDAIMLATAKVMGLPANDEEALAKSELIYQESDRRFVGKPETGDPVLAKLVDERNGIDIPFVMRFVQAFALAHG